MTPLERQLSHSNKQYRQDAKRKMNELVIAFHQAAIFVKHKIETEGWHWSDNFLREYVRCATPLRFSNSESPFILQELARQYPWCRKYIGSSKKRKNNGAS
jgi:hypothetical protein